MTTPIFNAVIGTAGHIDHGKSTLVKALTGIHPDRLPEEQEKGITIDLGFAPMVLKNGMRVGIIDVPGHERFVKNMVAGATGIDFVMLIVAADDGVMAQTREHLQIIQLLGVRDGVTVITKKDLVEPAYLQLVIDDVRALEAGTLLDGKPVVTISSKTGEGIPELKVLLEKTLPKLVKRASDGPFRMPIQRVFSKEGFGTVVTGVPLGGTVGIGDTLEILPLECRGRVKGLHAYSEAISRGQAGHSTAVNLVGSDIDKRQLVRGMTVVTPDVFEATNLITAHFTLLKSAPRPLKHRAAVRFHAGTSEIQAKILLLDAESLKPGSEAFVQVLLEEKTVLVPGDRFILRLQSPLITLGGGQVLDAVPAKRKRGDIKTTDDLKARLAAVDSPEKLLRLILATTELPKHLRQMTAETGLLPERVATLAAKLIEEKKTVALRAGAEYLSATAFNALSARLVQTVKDFNVEHPALAGIDRPELKQRFAVKTSMEIVAFFDEIVALAKDAGLLQVDSNTVSLPGRDRTLKGELAKQANQVEAAFLAGELAPPSRADVEAQLKILPKTMREILKYLRETGKLVDAGTEVVFHRSVVEHAKQKLTELFNQKNTLTTSEIRQHLGTSRKYAVPLVELLDKEKFTVRDGDVRKKL